MTRPSGHIIIKNARQTVLLCAAVAAAVAVLVALIAGRFQRTTYEDRQQTLSMVTESAASNFAGMVRMEWDIYNLSYSIAAECFQASDDIRQCITAINTQHDFGSDFYFLVDEEGGYYASDGVSGKLPDFTNYQKTSPDQVEYLATLPHLNPHKAYMIYRGRFDKVKRMHTDSGDKAIVFFAYAQDLTEIRNSIGGLFEDATNVFIFDAEGLLLYEDFGLTPLLDGYNIYRKFAQCRMPFGETASQLERSCRRGEDVVAQVRIKGNDYYFCSSPMGVADWTLALLVPPGNMDNHLTRGVSALILYSLAILLLIGSFLVFITYSFRVKAQEDRLEESRKLVSAIEETSRAKTVFLSNMSHDIRTPINGIIGVTSIARNAVGNPEKVSECLDKIDTASSHLLSLINDVLDMSRIESGKTTISEEAADIVAICENCGGIILGQIADRDLRFTTEFDVPHPRVFADQVHLRRIFINILGNAVKFTRDGGRILFRCRETGCEADTVTIRFEIKDTGIGMSRQFIGQIFEAFSQEQNRERTNYSGTGLGMAITKQLVDLMGGTIEVESEIGKGSSFYVTIPFRRNLEERAAELAVEEENADIEGVRILLVEDNELNMEIAESLLSMCGAVVDKAWDGLEALDRFTSRDIGTYDIILMDIMMPRMNGYEATRAIRALNREDAGTIPIVAMTANAFDEDFRASKEASMNAHLSKPIEIKAVVRTIHSLVHKS